ncbi:sensor histidine kinase [Nocardiopsis sp. CNT-189]|uniref:sensor histidine kinase n=1 Tax=Nocardiopsis oceanisediminis TaxID=2816862 RepID=UPI003B3B7330
MRTIRGPLDPDRRLLGGRLYLGSLLWACGQFALGLLLIRVNLYIERPNTEPAVLVGTLTAICLLVMVRRTRPGAALVCGFAVLAVDVWFGPSSGVLLSFGDLLYAACALGSRRTMWTAASGVGLLSAAALGLLAWAMFFLTDGGLAGFLQGVGLFSLLFVTPMITGLTVREHRERAELLRAQAEQRVRLAELDRANAITEERGRVARELHDVIANHLSAVAVQSTAALSRRDLDPERTRRVLEVVRDNSVQGLEEMRRMIGVLRAGSGGADPAAPRLSETDLLVRSAREAGLEVEAEVRGTPRELPAQVEAAAYRVVQEALTNALRYAEPARAGVAVEYPPAPGAAPDRLVVQVDNPVTGDPGERWDGGGAGVGLVGMRERAVLLGGDFSAGPAGGGTWRVRVELPCGGGESGGGTGGQGGGAEAGR